MVAVQQRSRPVPRQVPRQVSTVPVVPIRSANHRAPAARRPAAGIRPTAHPVARPAARPAARPFVSPSTYRRRQALAAGAVAVLAAAASVVLGVLGGGSLTAPERPLPAVAGQVYEVQAGDTFWAIARSLDPDGDPRPLVDRLVAEHGGPVLVVGEQLRLPA
jgi:nucleoid-associated protein YgaU